ncbi:MAG: hypothetical protein AB7O62_07970, partial [Pirellulales bacterium]
MDCSFAQAPQSKMQWFIFSIGPIFSILLMLAATLAFILTLVIVLNCTFRKLLPIFEIGLTKQMALLACCWLFNPNTHRRAKDGKME